MTYPMTLNAWNGHERMALLGKSRLVHSAYVVECIEKAHWNHDENNANGANPGVEGGKAVRANQGWHAILPTSLPAKQTTQLPHLFFCCPRLVLLP